MKIVKMGLLFKLKLQYSVLNTLDINYNVQAHCLQRMFISHIEQIAELAKIR